MGIKGWFTENLPIKGVALIVALLMHLNLRGDTVEARGYFVDIEYKLPSETLLLSTPPSRVKVLLQGKPDRFDQLGDQPPPPIQIAVTDEQGGLIPLTPDLFKVPPGLTVASVEPPAADVRVDRRASRRVAVTPRLTGQPAQGYAARLVRVEPGEVVASGARTFVGALGSLIPSAVDVAGRAQTFTTTVDLAPPLNTPVTLSHNQIEVTVALEPIVESRTLEPLAVQPPRLPDGFRAELDPPMVQLTLSGPINGLNALTPGDIVPRVEVEGPPIIGPPQRRRVLPGPHPDGLTLVQLEPETFQLRILPLDPPPPNP